MGADLFDVAAEKLESATHLNQLEARGTLRLALKSAGLTARNLTLAQLRVVFDKVMPGEMESRGVEDATATCTAVMAEVRRAASASVASAAPELSPRAPRPCGAHHRARIEVGSIRPCSVALTSTVLFCSLHSVPS